MKALPELFDSRENHARKVELLRAGFVAGRGPAALRKRTSNIFRPRDQGEAHRLDAGALDRVLEVDPERLLAVVEGMATFEDFTDACLAHGTIPTVVPELKTITVGGAITGIGIESSSFRYGFVHESVVEMEILCGDGKVRVCTRDNEHADLFFAIPNSYGTLGYVLRATLRVVPTGPRAMVEHLHLESEEQFLDRLRESCRNPATEFVEGVIFGPGDHVVTTARTTSAVIPTSSYEGMTPYHATLRRYVRDAMTVRDWLWRWDPDWFWCSRAFGMQNKVLRFLFKRWMLRSSSYWLFLTHYRKWRLEARIHRIKRLLGVRIELREPVIQDVEIPFERCAEFLAFYREHIDIRPCWVCPVVPQASERPWTLYPMEPGRLHLNFGFWESVPTSMDLPADHFNRLLEAEVVRLGGRKSLYSSVHFTSEEFWKIHDRPAYLALRDRYDPEKRFRDLWEKVAKGR